MKGMFQKARIPVDHDKGRVLLGVMDEEGVLEYGEVFIRISEDIYSNVDSARVVEGDVAIAKCPCLHPGRHMRKQQPCPLCFEPFLLCSNLAISSRRRASPESSLQGGLDAP